LARGVLPKVNQSLKPFSVSTGASSMSVDNPKGGPVIESTHSVKTLAKAQEWYSDCTEDDLPILVLQQNADTRLRIRIYDKNNNLITSRG